MFLRPAPLLCVPGSIYVDSKPFLLEAFLISRMDSMYCLNNFVSNDWNRVDIKTSLFVGFELRVEPACALDRLDERSFEAWAFLSSACFSSCSFMTAYCCLISKWKVLDVPQI